MTKEILREIKFSGIGKMVNLADRTSCDLVRFETGDVDFPTPHHIIKSAHDSLLAGYTHYGPFQGYTEFKDKIIKKLATVNQIKTDSENVLVTSGGSNGLFLTFSTILSQDDEVILSDPYWSNLTEIIL